MKKPTYNIYREELFGEKIYLNEENYQKFKAGQDYEYFENINVLNNNSSSKTDNVNDCKLPTKESSKEIDKYNKPDMVNSPPHYQSENGIECIDAIIAALGKEGAVAYCRGNVIKYSWRIKNPNEDMAKAAWYSNKANELFNSDTP